MTEQITFIHAADLHLDSPFKGLSHIPEHIFQEVRKSTFDALTKLVQTAIVRQVDFVLITGDLFDNEKQSLKAQVRLKRAFEELQREQIAVYLSYGNHDFINGNVHPIEYPENVCVFPDEKVRDFIFEKNGKQMASIYGFSYENRSVTENKVSEYQPMNDSVPFHIAMLHGSLHTNTDHDVYAPFHISDLVEKNVDYWALGHIHVREVLKESPAVVYPGNIQGRSRKESGEKGCYHVVMNDEGTTMNFVPLQAIQFNELHIDAAEFTDPHQLETKLQQEVNDFPGNTPQLLQLNLKDSDQKLGRWENDGYIADVIDLVNESNSNQSRWKLIYHYQVEKTKSYDESQLSKGHHFVGEVIRHINATDIQNQLTDLYRNKLARKYLQSPQAEDKQDIKKRAKQLLIDELLKHGGD
ncbi:metallophosphoesterase family protein [Virgibacillus siamensis]|uniref:metallophosphoesterase family protein n=1 Tax=Virgibacillus siamensis TaxID=480071 RepID=UPI000987D404|nr:DNA repair exonuclease [Virgibacillus siamensis]